MLVGLGVLLLVPVVVAVLAVAAILGTAPGNRWLLARLLPLVQPPAGSIAVGSLHTDLLGGVRVEDVSIRDREGHELYGAAAVEADVRLGALIGRRLVVDRVVIDGLRVALADGETCLDPAGPWDDGTPSQPSGEWTGLGFDLDVRSVSVVASVVRFCAGSPFLVAPATLTGSVTFNGPRLGVDASLRGLAAEPAWGPLALDVAGSWTGPEAVVDELRVALGPDHARVHGAIRDLYGEGGLALTVDELAVFPAHYGADAVAGPLTLTGKVTGPLRKPALDGALGTPGGPAAVTASLDLTGERPGWAATVDTPGLAVHAVVPGTPETVLAGKYAATGVGFGWPDDLDATITVDGAAPVAGGYAGPFRVTGSAGLHGGELDVTGLEASTRGVRVAVDGAVGIVDGRARLVARTVRADLARLADFGVPGLAGDATFTGRVDVRWAGAAEGQPVAVVADGVLAATDLDVQGAVTARAASGPVRVRYEGGLEVDAHLDAADLAAADLTLPAAHVDAAITRSAAGALGGRVDLEAGAFAAYGHTLDGARVGATLDGDSIGVQLVGRQGPVPAVVAEGRVGLDPVVVDLDRVELHLGGVTVGNDGPVHLRVVDGGVADARAALRIGDGRVEVTGDASPHGPLALHVQAEGVALDDVPALVPGTLVGWHGAVDLDATLGGTGDDPTLDATAAARGLTIPDALVGVDARLTARRDGDAVHVDLAASGEDGPLLTATGTVPVVLAAAGRGLDEDAPIDLVVDVPPGDEGRFRAALPALATLTRELRFSAEARLGGTLRHPELALTSTLQTPVEPGAPWLTVDFDGRTENGRLKLRTIVRDRLVRRAEVTGSLRLDLARASAALRAGESFPDPTSLVSDLALNVVPLQLPIEALAPNALAGVSGSLLGGLYVSGDELAPQVQGAVMVLGGKLGRVPLSSAQVTITPSEAKGYAVDLSMDMGEEGGLSIHGVVPWSATLDQDLVSAAERTGILLAVEGAGTSPSGTRRGLPLAALDGVVPGFEGATGLLEVSGAVGGTFGAPDPRLTLKLRDGSFSLRDTGVRYHGIELDGTVDKDAVRVSKLVLDTDPVVPDPGAVRLFPRREGEHDVTMSATMGLEGWSPTTVRGSLALVHAHLLAAPSRRVQASGDLALGGTWPRFALRGEVGVDDGYIRLTESFFTKSDELTLDPAITVVRSGVEHTATTVEDGFPMPDLALGLSLARHVDVDVTMPTEEVLGNLGSAFSNLRVKTTLDGDVDLEANDGVIALSGQVDTIRGDAAVLGRSFGLSGGSLAFTGRAWSDPILALSGTYNSGGYGTITADIGGTASAPTIALSGSDGLGPDDAVAVLLFGAPLGGGGGGGGADALVGLLLTSLSKEIQQAKEATTLDVIELGLGGSTRVGKRLGRTVLVVVELNPSPDDDESPVTVQMELQLPKRWFMVAEYGSRGEAKVSALRKWRL